MNTVAEPGRARPRPSGVSDIGSVRSLVLMARPSQLALIVLVYISGVLLAAWRGGTSTGTAVAAAAAIIILALVLGAAVAVHWANEAADADTDRLTVRTPFSGGSGALVRSSMDPKRLIRLSILVATLVGLAALAMMITRWVPVEAALLLFLGLLGGLAYSLPPVAAMRRGAGESLNALLGGLMLPLAGVAAVGGRVTWLDVIAFLPFLFVVQCSVLATAWPDRAADARTGKRTLAVRLPTGRLSALYLVAAALWLGSAVLSAALDAAPVPLVVLCVLPLLAVGGAWFTRRESPWPSVAAMVGHIGLTAVTSLIAVT